MALAAVPRSVKGHASPRIAPPRPVRSGVKDFVDTAEAIGIDPMPWQKTTATYIEATTRNRWTWPEVAVAVGSITAVRPKRTNSRASE